MRKSAGTPFASSSAQFVERVLRIAVAQKRDGALEPLGARS